MNNIVRTSVAVAALIAGAALVNAQTDTMSPQGGTSTRGGAEQKFQGQGQGQGQPGKLEQKGQGLQPGSEGRSITRQNQGPGETKLDKQQPKGQTQFDKQERKGQGLQKGTEGRSGAKQQMKQPGETQVEKKERKGQELQKGTEGRSGAKQQMKQPEPQVEKKERKGQELQTKTEGRSSLGTEGRSSFGLTQDQRVNIRQNVINMTSARVDRVDFAVTVGTVVPRHLHFVTLPPRVVQIVPRFRGFKFFIVGDEIVIVHPRTLRIVAIIPA